MKWKFKLGIILILFSVMTLLALFIIPFIEINRTQKVTWSTVLIVTGETTYWVGVLLIGKRVWKGIKIWLKTGKWIKNQEE